MSSNKIDIDKMTAAQMTKVLSAIGWSQLTADQKRFVLSTSEKSIAAMNAFMNGPNDDFTEFVGHAGNTHGCLNMLIALLRSEVA